MGRSMSNGRKINLAGTCSPEDLPALEKELKEHTKAGGGSRFGPLSLGEKFNRLPDWAQESFNVLGVTVGDDCDATDIAKQLRVLAKVAPSLKLKAHVGAQWESKVCIATVTLQAGEITVSEAEIADVHP